MNENNKDYRARVDRELQKRLDEFAEKLGVSLEPTPVPEFDDIPPPHYLRIPRLIDGQSPARENDPSAIHSGHRERLRASIRRDPRLDGFSDVEILEILLSFVIPQRDTNVIAHALLDEFGSIAASMTASPEKLFGVRGMTKGAAELLPALWRVCSGENSLDVIIHTRFDALNFFGSMYLSGAPSGMCVAYIDDNNQMIALERVNVVPDYSYRFAVGSAIKYGAVGVLLVWFGRETIGIGCDAVAYVKNLARVLDTSGVTLCDFIMLTDYGYYTPGLDAKNYDGWVPQFIFIPERNFVRSLRLFEIAHTSDGVDAEAEAEGFADTHDSDEFEPIGPQLLSDYLIKLRGEK